MNPLQYCQDAAVYLEGVHKKRWAEEYVRLLMQFYGLYCKGFLFSTRFGIDFFTEVADRLKTGKPLEPLVANEPLGEYDANFNKWLKLQRSKS